MNYWSNCDTKVEDGQSFCTNCGSKLAVNAELCGNCGTKQEKQLNLEDEGTVGLFTNEVNDFAENDLLESKRSNQVFNGTVPQPTTKKKNTGLIVGIVAAVLIILAFIGSTAEKVLQNNGYGSGENEISTIDSEEMDLYSDEEEKQYKKGSFTTTTYESEFIGIRYSAPGGWVLATESELAQMPSDPNTTWEMQAISSWDGSNILVAVEKLPTENFSEDMYINSLKNTLQSNSQLTVSEIEEAGTKMIAGKEYRTLSYKGIQNGVEYTQTFYVRKINAHIVALTVTSTLTGSDEILSYFSTY